MARIITSILGILLFNISHLIAQNPLDKEYRKVRVIAVSAEEFRQFVLSRHKTKAEKWLQKPGVDMPEAELEEKAPELPYGHYLIAGYTHTRLKLSAWSHFPAIPQIQDVPGNLYLRLFSKGGESLTGYKVVLNKKVYLYNAEKQAWVLPPSRKGLLELQDDKGGVELYDLSSETESESVYKRNHWKYKHKKPGLQFTPLSASKGATGFVAMDKPKYRPGDSIHYKAFLWDKDGNPATGDLWILFKKESYRNSETGTRYPATLSAPGCYVWNGLYTDSMEQDAWYDLSLQKRDGGGLQKYVTLPGSSISFRTEEYTLDQYRFDVTGDATGVARDSLLFGLSATDALGNPATGVRYKAVLLGTYMLESKTWLTELADTLGAIEGWLNGQKRQWLKFSHLNWPDAECNYELKVEFTTQNGELHNREFSGRVETQQRGNLHFRSKPMPVLIVSGMPGQTYDLYVFAEHGRNAKALIHRLVKDRDTLHWLPWMYLAKLQIKGEVEDEYQVSGGRWNKLFTYTGRYRDTAWVVVSNETGGMADWFYFENKKLMKQGQIAATETQTRMLIPVQNKEATVNLLVIGKYMGYTVTSVAYATPPSNALTVHMKLPADTLPGSKIPVTITVKDGNGSPVPNADVTLFGVNRLMGQINYKQPDWKHPELLRIEYNPWADLDVKENMQRENLTRELVHALQLQDSAWFRFALSGAKGSAVSSHLKKQGARISAAVFQNLKFLGAEVITVDGRLVYSKIENGSGGLAFAVNPGVHKVVYRTEKYTVMWDSVNVNPGAWLQLSCDLDSVIAAGNKIKKGKIYAFPNRRLNKREIRGILLQYLPVYYASDDLWATDGRVYRKPGEANESFVGPFSGQVKFIADGKGFEAKVYPEVGKMYRITTEDGKLNLEEKKTGKRKWTRHWKNAEVATGYSPNLPATQQEAMTAEFSTYALDYPSIADGASTAGIFINKQDLPWGTQFYFQKRGEPQWYGMQMYGWRSDNLHLKAGNWRWLVARSDGISWLAPWAELKPRYHYTINVPAAVDSVWVMRNLDSVITGPSRQFVMGKPLFRVTGRLRSADGNPLFQIPVSAKGPVGIEKVVTTDENGNFTFMLPDFGDWNIKPQNMAGRWVMDSLNADTPVLFRLKTGYRFWNKDSTGKIACFNGDDYSVYDLPGHIYQPDISLHSYFYPGFKRGKANTRTLFEYDWMEDIGYRILPRAVFRAGSVGSGKYGYKYTVRKDRAEESDLAFRANVYFAKLAVADSAAVSFDNYAEDKDADMVKDAFDKNSTNRIRENFRDAAFWLPSLKTDAKGEVHTTVTLPDDITTWDVFAAAASDHYRHATWTESVITRKKLLTELHLPRVLLLGDSALGLAHVYRTDSTVQSCRVQIQSGSITNGPHALNLQKDHWLPFPMFGKDTGLLYTEVKAESAGIKDAERRKIQVLDTVTWVSEGGTAWLGTGEDTVITIPAGTGMVHLYSNGAYKIQEAATQLVKTTWECNEQMASKLVGYFALSQYRALGSTELKDAKRLYKKLIRNQHDGTWGWWGEKGNNLYMTHWICRVLQKTRSLAAALELQDEVESAIMNSYTYLKSAVKAENGHYIKWEILNTLLEIGMDTAALGQYGWEGAADNPVMRLQREYLRKIAGLNYDTAWYRKLPRRTSLTGEMVFSDPFAEDQVLNVWVCRMAKLENRTNLYRSVQRSMVEQLQGAGIMSNTFANAHTLLAWVTEDMELVAEGTEVSLRKEGEVESRLLKVGDWRVLPAGKYTISARTGAVLAGWWYPEKSEKSSTHAFQVQTQFEQGLKTTGFKKNTASAIKVSLQVNTPLEYVQLDIPIPAGCNYQEKEQGLFAGAHLEYDKDRVVAFIPYLAPGKYEYSLPLQSRFEGNYQVLPAHLRPMYFPMYRALGKKFRVRISGE
ncbi:MAG: hypothetical protein JNL57_13825 [Bacteroidetes bacterium]|nr:hypothetical protein [Bacteroidota bacterium]